MLSRTTTFERERFLAIVLSTFAKLLRKFLIYMLNNVGQVGLSGNFAIFFAKFWYILEIFAKFCLIKPSFAKFPFIYSIFRLFGITDLLTKSKFWPKHTFAGAPTATFFKILPFFWPPQLLKKSQKSLADPNIYVKRSQPYLAVLELREGVEDVECRAL